jgi:hypothetical protein
MLPMLVDTLTLRDEEADDIDCSDPSFDDNDGDTENNDDPLRLLLRSSDGILFLPNGSSTLPDNGGGFSFGGFGVRDICGRLVGIGGGIRVGATDGMAPTCGR